MDRKTGGRARLAGERAKGQARVGKEGPGFCQSSGGRFAQFPNMKSHILRGVK